MKGQWSKLFVVTVAFVLARRRMRGASATRADGHATDRYTDTTHPDPGSRRSGENLGGRD